MRGDVVSTIDAVSDGVELSRMDESVVNTNVVSGDWETPATELEIEMISDGLLLRGSEVVGSNWIEVDSAVSLVKEEVVGVGTKVDNGGVALSVLETKDVTCGVSVDSGVRNVVTASVLLVAVVVVAVVVVAVAVVCVTIVPEMKTLSLGVSTKLEVGVSTKLEVSSTIVSVGEGVMFVVSTAETKLCVVS